MLGRNATLVYTLGGILCQQSQMTDAEYVRDDERYRHATDVTWACRLPKSCDARDL